MGKKLAALAVMTLMAAVLLVCGLVYVNWRGPRVEVEFQPSGTLDWPGSELRAAGLERGGFWVDLRRRGDVIGFRLSPAHLKKLARLSGDEAQWLDRIVGEWSRLSQTERTAALKRITSVIRRDMKRHGGRMEEYVQDRVAPLHGENERNAKIMRLIEKLEWGNFPATADDVKYVPDLTPCEPADNVPRRVIVKDPFDKLMDDWRRDRGGAIEWGEPKKKPEIEDAKPESGPNSE